MEDLRVFRVDDHILRIDVGKPSAAAQVFRYGRWMPVVLTSEEVLNLTNAQELTPEEIRELDLPS
jgi:hypothetical protein